MTHHSDHPVHITRQTPLRLAFIGSGGEYFRIWIVNLLLSVITLGLYSPWAKVRRERYFASHTLLKDSPFEYHGKPLAILKGRLLALAAIVVLNGAGVINPYLALLSIPLTLFGLPWALRATLRFRAANTSWRGIRFSFRGTMLGAAKVVFGWGLLNIITIGLTFPASIRAWHRYVLGNLYFGTAPFRIETRVGAYYRPYVVLAAMAAIIGVALTFAANTMKHLLPQGEPDPLLAVTFSLAGMTLFVIGQIAIFAYAQVRIRNHLLNHTMLARHGLGSDLHARDMVWLLLRHGLFLVLSCGLYLPVLIVALRRYRAQHTLFYEFGSLDEFAAGIAEEVRATGEGISDFLDLDLGL